MSKLLVLIISMGATYACTSTAAYEDLDRRNQLLRLENDNLHYELTNLENDQERLRRELASAEKLASKRRSAVRDCQVELNAAQARAAH